MDLVDILLLCVVGLSVLVFFIAENLGSLHENTIACREVEDRSRGIYDSENQSGIGAGADDGEVEKHVLIEDSPEIRGERSGSCSGIVEDEVFDDWEGIERSDLERIFGEAVVFLSYNSNSDQIDGDLKLELYALQKVALEGPCYGSQPMALKVSARSKWNAWQKVGNMSREMAMDKYVNILTEVIPGWKGEGEGAGAVKDAKSLDQ